MGLQRLIQALYLGTEATEDKGGVTGTGYTIRLLCVYGSGPK